MHHHLHLCLRVTRHAGVRWFVWSVARQGCVCWRQQKQHTISAMLDPDPIRLSGPEIPGEQESNRCGSGLRGSVAGGPFQGPSAQTGRRGRRFREIRFVQAALLRASRIPGRDYTICVARGLA